MSNTINHNFNEILITTQDSKQKALKQVSSILIEFHWNSGAYHV